MTQIIKIGVSQFDLDVCKKRFVFDIFKLKLYRVQSITHHILPNTFSFGHWAMTIDGVWLVIKNHKFRIFCFREFNSDALKYKSHVEFVVFSSPAPIAVDHSVDGQPVLLAKGTHATEKALIIL